MYAKSGHIFAALSYNLPIQKSWSKERRESMSERIYNKLVLYANILQKLVLLMKRKSEILHTISKKAL